jgi:pyridoxal phosphate enzyme (YggS family)
MSIDVNKYREILAMLGDRVGLVAVSKTKPAEDIRELYKLGQRDFGENYVQEMLEKQLQLPADIRWHFIGHLQSNKVKLIAPFVHLIHGVDSFRLLMEINKQANKCGRVIACLLQVHIATEETKFGFDEAELMDTLKNPELIAAGHIQIIGLMGMASFSTDQEQIRGEFRYLKSLYDQCSKTLNLLSPRPAGPGFSVLSMGMSSDYTWAIAEGSTLVRIGSLIFGERK